MMIAGGDEDCQGVHRAPELHGRRGPQQEAYDRERPVLSDRGEVAVLTGRDAADPRRPVQQPRDRSDVPLAQSHDRAAAPHIVPLRRLRHQAELRLSEAVPVAVERLPGAGEPRLHGAVQSRSDHVDVRTASGDEETGTGREGIQGEFY